MTNPNPPKWPRSDYGPPPCHGAADIPEDEKANDSVLVFCPEDFNTKNPHRYSMAMSKLSLAGAELFTPKGHFSTKRYALLFKPGKYNIDVRVGYYVQVLGLGLAPEDVEFIAGPNATYGVHCPATDPLKAGSLDTFWRGVENIKMSANYHEDPDLDPTKPLNANPMNPYPANPMNANIGSGFIWAVSQAAPLRRVEMSGLSLFDSAAYAYGGGSNGNSSGGFIANCSITGSFPIDFGQEPQQFCSIDFGSQQQFCVRNCSFSSTANGAWSQVFINCNSTAPLETTTQFDQSTGIRSDLNTPAKTVENSVPYAEKPFITIDSSGKYYLQIPKVCTSARNGHDFTAAANTSVPFEEAFVAQSGKHHGADIQHALDKGFHVVLCPGDFKLHTSIIMRHSGQVLLGLGLAGLLAPTNGRPAVLIPSALVDVRIAGIVLEASAPDTHVTELPIPSSCLLQWGEPGVATNKTLKPSEGIISGVLSDVYARVGGAIPDPRISVDTMLCIHASHVIGDNLWLWRADHIALKPGEIPPSYPETTDKPFKSSKYHLVMWDECKANTGLNVTGNDVTMYGLASEHTQKHLVEWSGENGRTFFYQSELPYEIQGHHLYSGYHVSGTSHKGYGMGVYCFFRDDKKANVSKAIKVDYPSIEMEFINVFTKFLDGECTQGIVNVINDHGGPVGFLHPKPAENDHKAKQRINAYEGPIFVTKKFGKDTDLRDV